MSRGRPFIGRRCGQGENCKSECLRPMSSDPSGPRPAWQTFQGAGSDEDHAQWTLAICRPGKAHRRRRSLHRLSSHRFSSYFPGFALCAFWGHRRLVVGVGCGRVQFLPLTACFFSTGSEAASSLRVLPWRPRCGPMGYVFHFAARNIV